jgi:hypothetical protein
MLFVHPPKKKESDSCFLEITKLNSVFLYIIFSCRKLVSWQVLVVIRYATLPRF